MAEVLRVVLLTALTASLAHQAGAQQLPDSFALLPLSAFTDSNHTTLVSDYNCDASYASSPCSGHGSCYLLLDSAAPNSQPFIQAAAIPPLPVSQSSLDTYGIDHNTRLPAAVCICDSGWTGRGDYINHHALDGDSCHINHSVVVGLCITGIVLSSLLALLALRRLSQWCVWHSASLSHTTAAQRLTQINNSPTTVDRKPTERRSHTPSAEVDYSVSRDAPAAARLSTAASNQQATTSVNQPPTACTSDNRTGPQPAPATRATCWQRRRDALLKDVRHITFVHPLCSLIVAACILVYYTLRLTSSHTIGSDYVLSAFLYVGHQPFCVAMGMAAANNLQLAAAFTRSQPGASGLSHVIRAAERYHIALCFYSFLGWIVIWLVPAYPDQQQSLGVAILMLCFFPDLLIGPTTVFANRRVTAALIQNLESLTAEQQNERRTVYRKLRNFSWMIMVIVVVNGVMCVLLAASASLRQAGLPLYSLVWPLTVPVLVLGLRLLLLKMPRRNPSSAAVHPTASPAAVVIVNKPAQLSASPSLTETGMTRLLHSSQRVSPPMGRSASESPLVAGFKRVDSTSQAAAMVLLIAERSKSVHIAG